MENQQIELIKLAQRVAITQFQLELIGKIDSETLLQAKADALKVLGIEN